MPPTVPSRPGHWTAGAKSDDQRRADLMHRALAGVASGDRFLLDPEVPLVIRLGVGTLTLGALLLLTNILRERLYRRKTERYDEVVR